MRAVDPRQLTAFIAVYEELHFARAANRLGMLQPQLSLLVQRLEDIIGHRLFVRRPAVVPTAAAHAFVHPARSVLADLQGAISTARLAARGYTGTLSIGYPTWVGATFIADGLVQYRKKFPNVSIQLQPFGSAEQIEELQRGRLDIGFLRDVAAVPNCEVEPLFSEPWVVALPVGHPKAVKSYVTPADLDGERLVGPDSFTPWLQERLRELVFLAGAEPRLAQEAASWYTILSLVRGGAGIAVVPKSQAHLWKDRIVYLCFKDTEFPSTVRMFFKKDLGPLLDNFVAIIRSIRNECGQFVS